MQNTNTTYSLSEPEDSIPVSLQDSLPFQNIEASDSIVISPVKTIILPEEPLQSNKNLSQDLIYTVVFLIIFAFVRLRSKDLFHTFFNILIKRKKAGIILNEGIGSNLICYILSLFLSFSAISICTVYLFKQDYLFVPSSYLFLALTAYHFFLLGLLHLLGWTFNAKYTAAEATVNLWTYHIMSGLTISPFVIAIFFVKSFAVVPLLKIVLFGLIIFQIVKFARWVEILFVHRVSILYIILYLCALEVIPLLFLYKWMLLS